MNEPGLRFPVVAVRNDTLESFVGAWSRLYRYPDDHLYTDNVGRELNTARLLELFRWKNGGPLSDRKRASVLKRYDGRFDLVARAAPGAGASTILREVGGGAVWGIFFLHCLSPDRFPIFDQHVHRAACCLRGAPLDELPRCTPDRVLARYEREYLPFLRTLAPFDRRLDQALWSFGKAIKPASGSQLDWAGIIRAEPTQR
ncbi:MAG: hypothetical protein AAFP26_03335, partial [Planctomycetota bacterium]